MQLCVEGVRGNRVLITAKLRVLPSPISGIIESLTEGIELLALLDKTRAEWISFKFSDSERQLYFDSNLCLRTRSAVQDSLALHAILEGLGRAW